MEYTSYPYPLPYNHYIVILQNKYTKQTGMFDMQNVSDSRLYIRFENFEMPDDWPIGEYDYYMLWCILDYELWLDEANPLDSVVKVTDLEGNEYTYTLRQLHPDTGILRYVPSTTVSLQADDTVSTWYSDN